MSIFLLLLLNGFIGYNTVLEVPQAQELPHALYLSVVQIDHRNPGPESEVLVKVFASDLEDVIRAGYPDEYQRSEPDAFCRTHQQLIEGYFQTRLVCTVNGNPTTLSFLNGSRENEVYWLKFSLHAPAEWKAVKIKASFFMEIFAAQSNIIHLLHGAEKRFGRLTKEADETAFEF